MGGCFKTWARNGSNAEKEGGCKEKDTVADLLNAVDSDQFYVISRTLI